MGRSVSYRPRYALRIEHRYFAQPDQTGAGLVAGPDTQRALSDQHIRLHQHNGITTLWQSDQAASPSPAGTKSFGLFLTATNPLFAAMAQWPGGPAPLNHIPYLSNQSVVNGAQQVLSPQLFEHLPAVRRRLTVPKSIQTGTQVPVVRSWTGETVATCRVEADQKISLPNLLPGKYQIRSGSTTLSFCAVADAPQTALGPVALVELGLSQAPEVQATLTMQAISVPVDFVVTRTRPDVPLDQGVVARTDGGPPACHIVPPSPGEPTDSRIFRTEAPVSVTERPAHWFALSIPATYQSDALRVDLPNVSPQALIVDKGGQLRAVIRVSL